MTRVLLLGMVPLYVTGKSQVALGRNEADGHAFLRNGGGRTLQAVGECGEDFAGVRSSGGTGKVCCVEECGQCGGDGCAEFGKDLGLTQNECCTTAIEESGVMCSDTMEAPCVIEVNIGECGEDFAGVRSSGGTGKVCCVEECGQCGGDGCAEFRKDLGLTQNECCTTAIEESGVMCSDTMEAPCVIEVNSDDDEAEEMGMMDRYEFVRCGEGVPDDFQDGQFSIKRVGGPEELSECYQECLENGDWYFAVWGDSGFWCACGNSLDFFDADYEEGTCDVQCADNEDEICGGETSYSLYEILEPNELPKCSGGIVGVEAASGNVCCNYRCGTCGGDRCGGNGGCCEHSIQEDGILCSESGTAPCIFVVVDPTPAPTDEPDETPAPTVVTDETPAPTVVTDETPVPTVVTDETPAPTVVTDETPVPTVVTDETLAPTVVTDETPAPTVVADETPAPTVVTDETPAPTVVADETPAPTVVTVLTPSVVTPVGTPAPEQIKNYDFIRCSLDITEDADQGAFSFQQRGGNLNLENCYEECVKKEGALYFAVWGDLRYCGCGESEAFLDATDKPDGECDLPCPGDNTETCGGEASYELYEILDYPATPAPSELPKCSGGIVGVEAASGNVCCNYRCGTCGGDRCGGNGGCCEHSIQEDGILCSESGTAPCIFVVVDPTPAPTDEPDETPAPTDEADDDSE
eukprot:g3014.t1